MSWVAVAVAGVGLISTVVGATAGGGGEQATSTSTSKLEFPEETRRLFQDIEEPLLKGSLGEQQSLLLPLLGSFNTREAAQQRLGTARTNSLVLAASQRGATSAGITDFGPIEESTFGLSPELLEGLKQLVLQRGQQINTVVPPGYGQFLSPSTFTQQKNESPGPDEFQTGFQIAQGLANVAGAFYGPKGG
jgi:hypothetical protein